MPKLTLEELEKKFEKKTLKYPYSDMLYMSDVYGILHELFDDYTIIPKGEEKYTQAEIDSWNGMGK